MWLLQQTSIQPVLVSRVLCILHVLCPVRGGCTAHPPAVCCVRLPCKAHAYVQMTLHCVPRWVMMLITACNVLNQTDYCPSSAWFADFNW